MNYFIPFAPALAFHAVTAYSRSIYPYPAFQRVFLATFHNLLRFAP